MNKLMQNLFLVVCPFFPLWAWLTLSFLHFPAEKILAYILLPILVYIVWSIKVRAPAYLIFFITFTIYHHCSILYYGLVPANTTNLLFILSDPNTLACLLLLVAENTNFEESFIKKMNQSILWIVVLSLLVSVVQIKNPLFFYNVGFDDELTYVSESRIASIYSWVSLNAVGVTFPILISILLNVYSTNSKPFPLITVSGIVVAFLTKARYVMISTIIAFLQLLLIKTTPLKKKIFIVGFFVAGVFLIVFAAQMVGYDIDATINERILEKGNDMGSAKTRLLSYDVFLMKFPENPYFGVGPKTRDDVVNLLGGDAPIIHVGYLSYLYYYGFFGALLLFLSLLCLMWDAWIVGRRYDFWGSFYGLLGFALANFTLVYFNFSEMGIILAVIYIRYYNLNQVRLYSKN